MVDPLTSIILLTPVPDFRQMAYFSIEDMVADSWLSLKVVELGLPMAIATIRHRKVAGFQIVTHERTTDSKYKGSTSFQLRVTVKVFPWCQTLCSKLI